MNEDAFQRGRRETEEKNRTIDVDMKVQRAAKEIAEQKARECEKRKRMYLDRIEAALRPHCTGSVDDKSGVMYRFSRGKLRDIIMKNDPNAGMSLLPDINDAIVVQKMEQRGSKGFFWRRTYFKPDKCFVISAVGKEEDRIFFQAKTYWEGQDTVHSYWAEYEPKNSYYNCTSGDPEEFLYKLGRDFNRWFK